MWCPQRPNLDFGFWILDFGDLGILDFGDFGFWILDFGFWGFWILDFGLGILDFGTLWQNFGCYIRKEDCARRTGSAGFRITVPGRVSGAGSERQVRVPGQVPEPGSEPRFQKFFFRKKAYDLWLTQTLQLFYFSAVVAKRLEKTRFLNIPFKSGSVATSQIRTCNLFMVRWFSFEEPFIDAE